MKRKTHARAVLYYSLPGIAGLAVLLLVTTLCIEVLSGARAATEASRAVTNLFLFAVNRVAGYAVSPSESDYQSAQQQLSLGLRVVASVHGELQKPDPDFAALRRNVDAISTISAPDAADTIMLLKILHRVGATGPLIIGVARSEGYFRRFAWATELLHREIASGHADPVRVRSALDELNRVQEEVSSQRPFTTAVGGLAREGLRYVLLFIWGLAALLAAGTYFGTRYLFARRDEAENVAGETEQRYRRLFETSDDAVFLALLDGTILSANPAACRIFGYSEDELRRIGRGGVIDPGDERLQSYLARRVRDGRAREELTYVRKDGSRFPGDTASATYRDAHGAEVTSVIIRDMTRRRRAEDEIRRLNAQLEQRVEERTEQLTLANRELEAANEQLESFSYSVSHDLRGPLRHINAFAKLLLERARGLDPAERGYLETIAMSSQWMGGLVDDLLSLARATRADFHPARLDLQALVESAREQCLRDVSARHIEWKLGELPEVEGDWTLLKSAFVNLLENAVKFTRPRDPAIIEVGARPGEDGQVVVYVKDNGVGFDMDYADKLFGVFQRMHGQDEFEGTGVGLATVQRIVARHGGQVWAEAAPGSGATFSLALHLPQQAEAAQPETTRA